MKGQNFRTIIERWLLWVLVTGIAWPASVFLTVLLIEYSPFPASTGLEIALDILLGSLLIAAAQLLILRPDVKGIGLWLGTSLIGWSAGNALILTSGQVSNLPWVLIIAAAFGGGVYGWFQGLGVGDWSIGGFGWVIQSAVSWIAAYSLGIILQPRPTLGDLWSARGIMEQGLVGWGVLSVAAALILVVAVPREKRRDLEEASEAGPWWPE
jgi:hypothetical protein